MNNGDIFVQSTSNPPKANIKIPDGRSGPMAYQKGGAGIMTPIFPSIDFEFIGICGNDAIYIEEGGA